ncbi:hypothetical protein VTL71DRAFT_11197 [Oculimacula yallundae]|uniref:Heterokaryon incompatibility domain-containing protein n=1 Tax=Oculimacula yallundae TaxID=86028 RepID=A0ABR4CVA0_9HELO
MSSSVNVAFSVASSLPSEQYQYEPFSGAESEIRLLRILPSTQPLTTAAAAQVCTHDNTEMTVLRSGRKLLPYSSLKPRNHRIDTALEISPVHCEMMKVVVEQTPPYKALSYTWGGPNDSQYSIKIDGKSFSVRENLWLALLQLRSRSDPTIVWIDAICINQSDKMERNGQVGKMRNIYENAEEVVAWLGPSYDDSDMALQFVWKIYQHEHDIEWIARIFNDPKTKTSVLALSGLLNRKYWARMWIVQELVVARRVIIQCGTSAIEAVALEATQRLLYAISERQMGFKKDYLAILFPNDSRTITSVMFRGLRSIMDVKETFKSQESSFFTYLLCLSHQRSTDPRDMVYGLAALANPISPYKIQISYSSSVSEVFADLARKELQHCKSLLVLTRARSNSRIVGLPSWVPEWSRQDRHYFLREIRTPQYFYSAARDDTMPSIILSTPSILILKAIVIGVIEKTAQSNSVVSRDDSSSMKLKFLSRWNFVATYFGHGRESQVSLGRTLLCDQLTHDETNGLDFVPFYQYFLGMWFHICVEENHTDYPDPVLAEVYSQGMTQAIKMRKESNRTYNKEDIEILNEGYVEYSADLIWDRQLFLGSSNIMGLGPIDVEEGDIICVPLGCPHPMIFRQVADHYTVIGEAYVDEYMYGKAVDMWEKSELQLETFELH